MREVTHDEWMDFINAAIKDRAPGSRGQFTDDGDDAMNYVVDGKVLARSEGYALDATGRELADKRSYFIDG